MFATIWLQLNLSTYDMNFDYSGHIERSLARSIRLPPRTWVAYDEFFKKPPPDDLVQDFFAFRLPSYSSLPAVQPFWTCQMNTTRQGKLVYIHMYRSAGFTVRALLRAYAQFCGTGIAFVSHCLDVSLPSMEGQEFWINEGISSPRRGQECWLSYLQNRTGQEYLVNKSNSVSTALFEANQVDILGDHLPVGSLQNWKNNQGDTVDARYIVSNPLL